MDLEMVFNELSLRPLATDTYAAQQRMSTLLQTIIAATRYGVKRVVRAHSKLEAEELAPGYPIARWLNDQHVDKELRRLFLTLTTKAPFLEDISQPDIEQKVSLSDASYAEKQAAGLGVAYWLEALAISLRSEARWDNSHLQIRIIQIDESSEISETTEEIPHASAENHVQDHVAWIKTRLQQEEHLVIHDGITIWKEKETWFPHLSFCDNVQEQLQNLLHGNLLLIPIMKRLHELEEFCEVWHEGPFDYEKMRSKVTNESEATMGMYGNERTFVCPDGISRAFRWHVRLTPGAWRLYFFPLPEEKKLIIGYIGPHLQTTRFH